MNKRTFEKHKAFRTQDMRGSPPPWGYAHQLFVFFIIFGQSSYMHKASKSTPQRTRDLCTLLDPPSLSYSTNPSTVSYNHLHLDLQASHNMHKEISTQHLAHLQQTSHY